MITRALVVRKNWLDLIFDQGKIWEMRSQSTKIRGRIGLIEAGSGLIVGETTLVDCLPALDESGAQSSIDKHQVNDLSLLEKWKYPWVLDGSVRYQEPIRYTHPPGAVIWVKLQDLSRPLQINAALNNLVCPS